MVSGYELYPSSDLRFPLIVQVSKISIAFLGQHLQLGIFIIAHPHTQHAEKNPAFCLFFD